MADISHMGHWWSVECVFPLISYFCYDSEILGWCKTEESVYFGVCCSASNVYSHSLWESTLIMHGSSCVLFTVSWWGNKISLYISTSPVVLINLEYSDVDVFLLYHAWLVVIEAQHAFHQQSHCVNYKHKEQCTSVTEGFHHVNMGSWFASWWTAWKEGLSLWSCKGTKTRLNELYIMCIWSVLYSDICS